MSSCAARSAPSHGDRAEAARWVAAGLAHDLNNALTCVIADVEILEEGLDAARRLARTGAPTGGVELGLLVERCGEWLRDLRGNIDAAARYGRELQTVVQPGVPARPLTGSVELAAAIQRSLRANAAELRQTQITVLVEPVIVAASEDATVRVLSNLLRNAAQAFVSGSIDRRVEIRTFATETTVAVEVSDNGPGVPPEILPGLFERTATTKAGGSGVGLASSRVLAREAGGDLTLVETGPHGTRFRLTLPRVG